MNKKIIELIPPLEFKDAEVYIPGSKSYTNRALILASIAEGQSFLKSPSFSDDSRALSAALKLLGVKIIEEADVWTLTGCAGKFQPYHGEINVGPAGTSMRFLLSVCAATEGVEIILSGSERMHSRPISDLVDALKTLGADIEYAGKKGCPPLRIRGKKLKGGEVKIAGNVSSQFFSSLLMAAALLDGELVINVVGEQISKSYIDMTLDSMRVFGYQVENQDYKKYIVSSKSRIKGQAYQIEGDASGASYLWGLAAVAGGRVKVMNVNPASAQGDIRFPQILKEMGCKVSEGHTDGVGWIEVGGASALKGVSVDMELMPDTAQTLSVIAATAKSSTSIRGLSTLKVKETDRLLALKIELAKLGISSEITDDSICIHPGSIGKANIATYEDHRMAMSFAILAAKFPGIRIEEPQVVTKSFPDFWEKLNRLGIRSI